MKYLSLNVLLLLLTIASFVLAQQQPEIAQKEEKFVSMEAGFSLNCPKLKDERSDINYLYSLNRDGGWFNWKNGQRTIQVICSDQIFLPANAEKILVAYSEDRTSNSAEGGKSLVERRSFKTSGNTGLETKLQIEGLEVLSRIIAGKNRICTLAAVWPKGEEGADQIAVLDSFEIVDNAEFKRKRIEDATPKPLPPFPSRKTQISDTQIEGLKGKVRTVYLFKNADATGLSKVPTSEDYYDKNGNRVKQVSYDYRANVSNITLYGSIDEKRVSKQGYISHGYDPPAPAPPARSAALTPTLPVEARYSYSYEYKFDDKGRLIEKISTSSSGLWSSKTIYTFEDDKTEENSFDSKGKLTSRSIKVYDKKGNLTAATYFSVSGNYGNDEHKFVYEEFDKHGNWTKRSVSGKTGMWQGGQKNFVRVDNRTIDYYP